MYPIEKVRDREWVKKMGHTPTLMDYSRFNYVAQPEDNIDVADLIPKIGPYDKWATMWGYKPIESARTPEDEEKTLNEWAKEQDKTPWLRFSTAGARGSDPGDNTEAVGDADAVKATSLGLKNIERVANMLLTATSRPGEPYDELSEVYGRLLGQWNLEMGHVVAIVGSLNSQQKHGGQEGVLFTPVAKEKQIEAVKFLNDHAFATPTWALKPEILRRIEPSGSLDRIKAAQSRVLSGLMNTARLSRLMDQEAIDGAAAYRPTDFLSDVREGIWRELSLNGSVKIDPYRRNLQSAYIDLMSEKLNGRAPVPDEQRPLIRGELRTLSQDITRALAKTMDRAVRLHLEDAKDQIAKALDPKFVPPAPAAPAGPGGRGGPGGLDDNGDLLEGGKALTCWPDYAIRQRY
jgi:hypothetical protein